MPEPSKPPPAPYSVPWQIRGVVPVNVVRLDNTIARYENAASKSGLTFVNSAVFGLKLLPELGIFARLTTVQDSPPSGNGGFVMANPAIGAVYGLRFGDFAVSGYLTGTIPVGGGGGNHPDPGSLDARLAGPPARMAMDNSLFAVNDVTIIPGVDVAYVAHGVTVQLEATFFQLFRVRGAERQQEATRTNFTSGLHVGYFVLPILSFGAELRYQRWIVPPFASPGHDILASDPRIDQWSMAVGPRMHFKLGKTFMLRPGIAYTRGLDRPLAAATPNYHAVQIDVPFNF